MAVIFYLCLSLLSYSSFSFIFIIKQSSSFISSLPPSASVYLAHIFILFSDYGLILFYVSFSFTSVFSSHLLCTLFFSFHIIIICVSRLSFIFSRYFLFFAIFFPFFTIFYFFFVCVAKFGDNLCTLYCFCIFFSHLVRTCERR